MKVIEEGEKLKFGFRDNVFVYIGLIISLIGALILFVQFGLMDFFYPQEKESLLEIVLDILKDEPEAPKSANPFPIIAIVLGVIGLILSLIGFKKMENPLLVWSTISLSIGVISWQFVIEAILIPIMISYMMPFLIFVVVLMLIGMILAGGG
jgi:hypothetical protein